MGNKAPKLGGASSSYRDDIVKISDCLYQLYEPTPADTASLDIFFFHGLEYEGPDAHDAHISSWRSTGENVELWPQKWLPEDFPEVRIVSAQYEMFGRTADTEGRMDLFLVGENLLQEIVFSRGAWIRPLILVGHGFGGIVIKAICVLAEERSARSVAGWDYSMFLDCIKGIFFYNTPHLGMEIEGSVPLGLSSPLEELKSHSSSRFAGAGDSASCLPGLKWFASQGYGDMSGASQSLVQWSSSTSFRAEDCTKSAGVPGAAMSVLNRSSTRLHEQFCKLERRYSWNISGLGAMQWTPGQVLVPEASSRFGDNYVTVSADHLSICRPSDRSSVKYLHLKGLIEEAQRQVELERMQSLTVPKGIVGVDGLLSEVLGKYLRDHSFVGIVGMVGAGKTTLAKLIYNKVCAKFEFTCFVDELEVIPGTREEVRRKVWQKMRRRGVPVSGELSGEQWHLVTGKSLFIVFEDVQDKEHVLLLREIADGNRMEESRFVLTSRSHSSLLDCGMDVHILHLSPLANQDARKLFTAYAFPEQEEPPKSFEKIVNQVVMECQGLPGTLVVLGNYLRGKAIELWIEVLTALRHCEDTAGLQDRVWAKLQLSYDSLPGAEDKDMFLDIASFFIFSKAKIPFSADDAVKAWSSIYGSALSRLEILSERYLVTVCHHEDELMHFNTEFSMHKLVRRLGQRIAELEGRTLDLSLLRRFANSSSAPEAEDQESYPSDDQVVFQEGQVLGRIVAHRVKINGNSMRVSRQTCRSCLMLEVWPKLTVIRYMELEINISDCCQRCRNRAVALPSSLVLLRLIGHGDDLSGTLSLTPCDSLVKLDVWGYTNLGELSQLQLLRILKISHCSAAGHWQTSLGKLRSLEQLELSYISEPFALPMALGDLTDLQHLRITCCPVTSIPDSFRNLTNLRYLEVDEIVGRQIIPNVIGSFRRLRSLKMTCWAIEGLMESFGELISLESLNLRCGGIKELPDTLGKLTSLRGLSLTCPVEFLPDTIGYLTNLEQLRLKYPLQSLPESFSNLKRLKRVDVCFEYAASAVTVKNLDAESVKIGVSGQQVIPDVFQLLQGFLAKCKIVELQCQHGATAVLVRNMVKLESLKVEVTSLQAVPDVFGDLHELQRFKLDCCAVENNLVESFRSFTKLENLDLCLKRGKTLLTVTTVREESLEITVKGDHGMLDSLRNLQRFLTRFKTLQLHGGRGLSAEVLRNFINLESLKIVLEGQEALADILGLLKRLRTLTLKCYVAENYLAESFRNLRSLEVLELRCERGEQLPSEFGCYSNLRTLKIQCPPLQALPGAFGMFVGLSTLHINEASLRYLPDTLGQLSQLQDLTIAKCKYLVTLPEAVGYLSSLLYLQLSSCESLLSLPETVWQLPRLRSLSLDRLKNLKSIPEGLGNLHSLRNLVVSCCSFKSLPESLGKLSNLRRLDVERSENLEMLPEAIGDLSSLKSLSVLGSGLSSLPHALGNLSQLETLDIRWCKNLTVSADLLVDLPSLKILHN
ncbi:hypothetical protein R1sor_024946 [Riccia sorocarpa]|uniref:NB-ARC domain-containing protein n=1 Tax=Riccia sorocarpa TaxID=122646 RepID=A0ABD3G752_9MARC